MYLIKNNLKKEACLVALLLLLSIGELSFLLINFFLAEKKDYSFMGFYFPIILFSILFIVSVIWLIYLLSYKVIVTEDKIEFKTILKHKLVDFNDIVSYSIGSYRRASYFQFRIDTSNDESIFINVKDKQKFIQIMKEKNIKIVD